MEIKVSLGKKDRMMIERITREWGITERDFIKRAVRDKMLEAKKMVFFRISDEVRKRLEAKGIRQRDVLEEFESVRYANKNYC